MLARMNFAARWGGWLVGGVILLALGLIYFRGGGTHAIGPGGLVGQSAPAFALPDLHGITRSPRDFRGKILVINLWASWCPPCRAEMPDLEQFARTYASRGVVVLGIDEGESRGAASRFAASLGVTYPIVLDEAQTYGRVYAALGIPTTAIVGPHGIVRRAFDGPLSLAQLQAAIGPMLGVAKR